MGVRAGTEDRNVQKRMVEESCLLAHALAASQGLDWVAFLINTDLLPRDGFACSGLGPTPIIST